MDWDEEPLESNESDERTPSKIRCAKCHRTIDFGSNAFRAEEGFIGPQGYVPLSDAFIVCNEKCLCEQFGGNGNGDAIKLPRRIP